jgi:hypothetical protein
MIRRITSILNEAVTALPVGVRVPFAEVIDGIPSLHAGGGQFVPVINDLSGGVSYWRANGAQSVAKLDRSSACGDAVRVSVPLVLVALVRRDQCDAPDELLNTAAHQVNASLRAVRDSILGAFGARVGGMSLGVDVARTSEVRDFIVPASLVVLTLSLTVSVDLSAECLDPCGEPYDLLCALIANASNAKVEECLGPERVEEICGGSGPCAPFTITINGPENEFEVVPDPCGASFNVPVNNTEGDLVGSEVDGAWQIANAIVLRDGVPYGSVAAEGSIDVQSDCPPCDPFTATLGGVGIINEPDPCGVDVALECTDLVDAVVVEGAGTEDANGVYLIETRGLEMTWRKPGGGKITYSITIGNEDYPAILNASDDPLYFTSSITNSDQADAMNGMVWDIIDGQAPAPTVRQATIADLCPCEGGPCDDATYQLKDSAGNNIGAPGSIASGASANITAPDGSVQRQDSAGGDIGSPIPVRSNENGLVVVCPDVTIVDQTATPIASALSGGTYAVIVVSGIDGGLSNTTYSNSIIQP